VVAEIKRSTGTGGVDANLQASLTAIAGPVSGGLTQLVILAGLRGIPGRQNMRPTPDELCQLNRSVQHHPAR